MIYLYIAIGIYLLIGAAISCYMRMDDDTLNEKVIEFLFITFLWLPYIIIDWYER